MTFSEMIDKLEDMRSELGDAMNECLVGSKERSMLFEIRELLSGAIQEMDTLESGDY